MSPHTEASALISSLSNISSKLFTEHSDEAKKEAFHLSKALTATLEEPENVAVELAFSVRDLPSHADPHLLTQITVNGTSSERQNSS